MENVNEQDTAEQQPSSFKEAKAQWLQPYQFKKGQSGNPSGRKAGKSLKEYAKEMLACMTDEERQEYLHGIPKELIWKLAEGNPKQDTDLTTDGEKIQFVTINYADRNPL